jgi:anti-sigma factor RsiW
MQDRQEWSRMPVDPNDLSCKELVELVTDYLEGRLAPPEMRRFEEHLAICPGCETYLSQIRQTISSLGTLKQDTVPVEARNELLKVFRNWKRG